MRATLYIVVRIVLAGAIFATALTFAFGSPDKSYGAQQGAWVATATPHYAHPVTGTIEDTGSDATLGQAMCKSLLYTSALIEIDSNNAMWATVRLNLMDKIESASFKVQKDSKSAFKATTATITKEDMSKNRSDFRMKIPSANAILRATFFVTPMGRDVVCYMTFKNLKAGHSDFVTSIKAADSSSAKKVAPPASGANSTSDANKTAGSQSATAAKEGAENAKNAESAAAPAQSASSTANDGSASALIQQSVGLTGKDGLAPAAPATQQAEQQAASATSIENLVLYVAFGAVIFAAFATMAGYYLYVRGVRAGRRLAKRAQAEVSSD
jgi:hypothetical protein